jgi:hypothetical protein
MACIGAPDSTDNAVNKLAVSRRIANRLTVESLSLPLRLSDMISGLAAAYSMSQGRFAVAYTCEDALVLDALTAGRGDADSSSRTTISGVSDLSVSAFVISSSCIALPIKRA